jgi:hypothetical protein
MMCGCGDKWAGPRLGFWVVVLLILFLMSAMGCAGIPVDQKCPEVKPVPKCPDTYAEQYYEAERAADRLEDALTVAEDEYLACERAFYLYQKKSIR